jgi:hypothetical protein
LKEQRDRNQYCESRANMEAAGYDLLNHPGETTKTRENEDESRNAHPAL